MASDLPSSPQPNREVIMEFASRLYLSVCWRNKPFQAYQPLTRIRSNPNLLFRGFRKVAIGGTTLKLGSHSDDPTFTPWTADPEYWVDNIWALSIWPWILGSDVTSETKSSLSSGCEVDVVQFLLRSSHISASSDFLHLYNHGCSLTDDIFPSCFTFHRSFVVSPHDYSKWRSLKPFSRLFFAQLS
jgi:hypothetical protein